MPVHRPHSFHTRCCICAFSSSALFVSSEHHLIDRICTSLWQSLHKALYIVYWNYSACFVNYTEKYQWTFAGGTKWFVLILVWLCFHAVLSAELDTMQPFVVGWRDGFGRLWENILQSLSPSTQLNICRSKHSIYRFFSV